MIGVLVSGEGTNLQALIDGGLPISAVASNRRGAPALLRARAAGIATASFSLDCFSPKLISISMHASKINHANAHWPEPTIAGGVTQVSVVVCRSDEYAASGTVNPGSTICWSSTVICFRCEQLDPGHLALM